MSSELIERLKQGCKVVAKLASSRGESFRMCIPPQKDDTDIFLIDAMKDAIAALEEVQARKELGNVFTAMAAKQERLPPEFEAVLHDNLSALYITDDLPAPPIVEQEGK